MTVRELADGPEPAMARALARFESAFVYPLGSDRRFRITHGEDYQRFFRALGEAACFVGISDGKVLGTISVALRSLHGPAGGAQAAAYIGDLKLAPEARGGFVLHGLLGSALRWAGRRTDAAYAVVMEGSAVAPPAYTGRAGIPGFRRVGQILLWRLSTKRADVGQAADNLAVDEVQGLACLRSLSRDRYWSVSGCAEERSELRPAWLMLPDASACGRLEDTRRAKRLLAEDGSELAAAHLACFAFRRPEAGVRLLRAALALTARTGAPALWVAVAAGDGDAFRHRMTSCLEVAAPAAVYGCGLTLGAAWNISSSEV